MIAGNATPTDARMMWNPSVNAIWLRAAPRFDAAKMRVVTAGNHRAIARRGRHPNRVVARSLSHNQMVWYRRPMAIELPVLSPRERIAGGCCEPIALPELDLKAAGGLAGACKALGDPTRVLIVDALRAAAPEAVCPCELLPLFDMSQPALAKHLKVLVGAGVVGTERRGLWAYYYLVPDAMKEL